MNKRYIDFVPAKKAQGEVSKPQVVASEKKPQAAVVTRTTVTRTTVTGVAAVSGPVVAPTTAPVAPARVSTPAKRVAPTSVSVSAPVRRVAPTPAPAPVRRTTPAPQVEVVMPAVRKSPTGKPPMGVVEDLNARFVTRDVPKRALGAHPTTVSRSSSLAVKPATDNTVAMAKRQKVKARSAVRPPVTKAKKPVEKSVENATYKTPKSPFINQNKVVKRPLSGNIYKRQIAEAVKEEPKGPVTIIAKPEKDKHIGVIVTIIITIILGAAAGTVAFLLLPK